MRMYRRTDEETMYCSSTKIYIQSAIGIANNFEALCTSETTRGIPVAPELSQSLVFLYVNTHRMK